LFDANFKKVARYQQYYGIKNAIKTITTKGDNRVRQRDVI
jgi:type I site-specific restriction-modification system R (restriction) subunit